MIVRGARLKDLIVWLNIFLRCALVRKLRSGSNWDLSSHSSHLATLTDMVAYVTLFVDCAENPLSLSPAFISGRGGVYNLYSKRPILQSSKNGVLQNSPKPDRTQVANLTANFKLNYHETLTNDGISRICETSTFLFMYYYTACMMPLPPLPPNQHLDGCKSRSSIESSSIRWN